MSDEQIIYLGPDEELTDVRQRLDKVPAERLILVVPPQTKLRSHVGWRLLHARTRELGKDVLVVSSDRQIRVVVKAAGFKVADSLSSPPSSKPRPTSRQSRPPTGSRPATRGLSARQRAEQQRSLSAAGPRPERSSPRPAVEQTPPPAGRSLDRQEPYIEDLSGRAPLTPRPPTAGQAYEFHIEPIESSPSLPPLLPQEQGVEEEPEDTLLEDIRTAQHIRQAAQEGPLRPVPGALDRQAYNTAPLPPRPELAPAAESAEEDPFSRIEDILPGPLPEQHGAFVPVDEIEEDIPEISSGRGGVLLDAEVEDLGDQGDIVLPATHLSEPWSSAGHAEAFEEEPDAPGLSRPRPAYGSRSRSSSSLVSRQEPGDEEELPEIDDLPTRALPPRLASPVPRIVSGSLAGPPQSPPARPTQTPVAPPRSASARPQPRPAAARVSSARPPRRPAPRRGGFVRGMLLFVALLVLLLVLLSALAYYVPSADVSFTLPARAFSQTLSFTASSTTRLDLNAHTLPAQVLVFTQDASTQGKASGVTRVGVVRAHGIAEFTNKSTRSLVIPTGTIITTASGVQFRTTAEPLITPGATYPVQIEAVNPGTGGNVPANTITVIPPESLQQIGASSGSLTVTNPNPTSGGGVGNAAQVTAADVKALKGSLDARLQQAFHSWLAEHVHDGDVSGRPVEQEQISASPAVGQVAPGGTFTATLTLQAAVLVVRSSDIQAGARAALNASIARAQPGYALVPQRPVSIAGLKSTPARDGKTLALSFKADGQAALDISDQDIQDGLLGKPRDEALSDLNGLLATRLGKQAVNMQASITISPSFFPWMPFIQDHIHIHRNVVSSS